MAKFRTIKDLVIDAYVSRGCLPSLEELTDLVKSQFPDSKWKKSHYDWYKSKIKTGQIGAEKKISAVSFPSKVAPSRKPSILNLGALTIKDLFKLHEDIFVELIERNIVHSSNNIIANYSEKLSCEGLELQQMPESTKGYDAIDKNGFKYEIKGRKPTAKNKSRQLSAIRSLDLKLFDYLVAVLYEEDFEVKRAAKIPHDIVLKHSVYTKHTNSWIFQIRDEVWRLRGVVDITAEIKYAEAKHSGNPNG